MTRKVEVRAGGHRSNLETFVGEVEAKMFPTPYGLSANQGQGDGEFGKAIRNWPTPRTPSGGRTVRLRDRPGRTRDSNLEGRVAEREPEAIGGQLNPMWVEWFMGFPLGWTDLEDSETPSSRRSLSGSDGE